MNQETLGAPLGLDRSAVSRIESGERKVDSLELSKLAAHLGRPIDWFIRERPLTIISRGNARAASTTAGDYALEDLVADVELLIEIGTLQKAAPPRRKGRKRLSTVADAERLARDARAAAGLGEEPIGDLVDVAEKVGLLTFVLDVRNPEFDGSYVALDGAGVALVPGSLMPGKRRFTIAHELGHHYLEDEFDTFVEIPTEKSEREKLIDAFAAHFMIPRGSAAKRFEELRAAGEELRGIALHLGQEYEVSWTALCAQLKNLSLVSETERKQLLAATPSRAEFLEKGLRLAAPQPAPILPSRFVAGVLRGYRARKLSASRAIQLLRGSLKLEELPDLKPIPLDALAGEIGADA